MDNLTSLDLDDIIASDYLSYLPGDTADNDGSPQLVDPILDDPQNSHFPVHLEDSLPSLMDSLNMRSIQQLLSMSTTFTPTSTQPGISSPPDIILISRDLVLFYCHWSVLLNVSRNQFGWLLQLEPAADESIASISSSPSSPGSPSLYHTRGNQKPSFRPYLLTEAADVINILLHLIYDMQYKQFNPDLRNLISTATALNKYGLSLDLYLGSSHSPLFEQIIALTPLDPLSVFIVAAQLNLNSLAVPASAFLLNLDVADLTDEQVAAMGSVYFRRLILLLNGRVQILRGLLAMPLDEHQDTPSCGFVNQKMMGKEWLIACAKLANDVTPDTPTSLIRSVLEPLESSTRCRRCRRSIHSQASAINQKWVLTKRTI